MARKKDKPAMMLLASDRKMVDLLSDEEAGQLFKAIYAYYCDGTVFDTESRVLQLAFGRMQQVIDTHNESYAARCQRNKEIAEERWAKKRMQTDTNVHERTRTHTNAYECLPIEIEKEIEKEIEVEKEGECDKSHTHARTHEGLTDFIEEAKTDQSYIEMLSMALHQPPDKVISLLSDFALECMVKEKAHTSRRDFRSHFFDWARIQTEKARKSKKQSSSEPTDINDLWK
jgi:hypothetical protein